MPLEEAIFSRRSVRTFLADPVPKEVVERVLQAGIAAPSALNSQPWRFIVATGSTRDEFVKIIRKFPAYLADIVALVRGESSFDVDDEKVTSFADDLGGAPVIIFATIPKKTNQYAKRLDLIGCASAIQNMQLIAWSLGLGSVCLATGIWVESEIAQALELKDSEIASIMVLGYRESDPQAPAKTRQDTVITWLDT